MSDNIRELADMIQSANYVVFFGGAGVSTESGVPDFRGEHGIYRTDLGAEQILTEWFMTREPEEYQNFYRKYFMMKNIEPNACHNALAELERRGKLKAIITQNVDGLHQKAGSERVLELHGSGNRFYCRECGKLYTFDEVDHMPHVPLCDCGGMIRSDIVLYGEGLDQQVMMDSVYEIERSDLLIVGGTSLTVYPAAGLIRFAPGKLAVINKGRTASDGMADLVIRENIGEVFQQVMDIIDAEDHQ